MRTGWKSTKLGEVFDVRDGTHNSPKYVPLGYPLITSKNLKLGLLDFGDIKYISEEDYKKINVRSAVHRGDILFAMIGTIGNPTIVTSEPNFAIKNVALFKANTTQNNAFLKYYLESPFVTSKMFKEANGTTQKFVGLGYQRNFPIELPPLPEQQRIVNILDQALEGIVTATVHADKNLANARELFESTLDLLYSTKNADYQIKRLSDVCLLKPPKSEARKNLLPTDRVSFVPMENLGIRQKYFDSSKERSLEEVAGSYTYFANGDVLLAKITPCFENGKLGIAQNLKNAVGFGSSEYIVFRCTNDINNEYLYYFLSRSSFLEDGASRMTGAVGHKRVSVEFIENTVIPIPPLSVQKLAVIKLNALSKEINKLEGIYQQKLVALEELNKSILDQAFSGNL